MLKELRRPPRRGAYFPPTPRGVRRAAPGAAPAASPTTPASPTSGSRRSRAVFWPCPAEDHPGTPRLFADRFPPRTDGPASSAVEHRPAAETPDDAVPARADHRPAAGAVPVGHADPRVPALAQRRPAVRRAAPRPGPPARHRRRRPRPADHAARARGSSSGSAPGIRPTRCSCRSTGAARQRGQPDPTPRSTRLADAGVQGRCAVRVGRPRRADAGRAPRPPDLPTTPGKGPMLHDHHHASSRGSSPSRAPAWTSPSPLHAELTYVVPTA